MGLEQRPSQRSYWSTKWGMQGSIPNILSRNRFLEIKNCLHIASNDTADKRDPFHKVCIPLSSPASNPIPQVRWLINDISKRFEQVFYPDKEVAVDEMMIPFKGRHKLKVRVRGKPHPSGFKVYALADSRTGYLENNTLFPIYVLTFCRYLRSFVLNGDRDLPRDLDELPPSAIPVAYLASKLSAEGHCIFVDNYYSGYELAWWLRMKKYVEVVGRSGCLTIPI